MDEYKLWNFNKKSYYEKFIESDINSIVLFGASKEGKCAFEHLNSMDKKVKYFCDNDNSKWGMEFCGIKVISPNELNKLDKNIDILITSMYYQEIEKQLKNMNFKNIYYIYMLGNDAGFYDPKELLKNKQYINDLFKILSDEKSKFVVDNILNVRYTQKYSLLEKLFEEEQYYPKDIIKLGSNETFVDAGAYDGDTIISFANKVNGNFKKIYAFEPDSENYNDLNLKIKQLNLKKVQIYKKGIVKFMSGYGGSSNIDMDGNEVIETINLDSLLKDEDINDMYIKMDIEGEELNALEGAKDIIINKKPKLAICIYHTSEHLWQIPLFIKSLVPEYKIYIRHHAQDTRETVCYAII